MNVIFFPKRNPSMSESAIRLDKRCAIDDQKTPAHVMNKKNVKTCYKAQRTSMLIYSLVERACLSSRINVFLYCLSTQLLCPEY